MDTINQVIFKASDRCTTPLGGWYRNCSLVHERTRVDPVSPTTNLAIKRLAFFTEIRYRFPGRTTPARSAVVSLSAGTAGPWFVRPEDPGVVRSIRTELGYNAFASAEYTWQFPSEGEDPNLFLSADCELVVESNISWPHIGSLATYADALLRYYSAMVSAVEQVTAPDIAWQDVVAASEQAAGVLARVEQNPDVDPILVVQVRNSRLLLEQSLEGVRVACGNGGTNECSAQQAAAIDQIRIIHDQVRDELEATRRFIDQEIARLNTRADRIAGQLRDILDDLRSQGPFREAKGIAPSRGKWLDHHAHLLMWAGGALEVRRPRESVLMPRLLASGAAAHVPLAESDYRPLETYGEETFSFNPPGTMNNENVWVEQDMHIGFIRQISGGADPSFAGAKFDYGVYTGYGRPSEGCVRAGPAFRGDTEYPAIVTFFVRIRTPYDIRRSPSGEYKINLEYCWEEMARNPRSTRLTIGNADLDVGSSDPFQEMHSAVVTPSNRSVIYRFTKEQLRGRGLFIAVSQVAYALRFCDLIYEIERYTD